MGTKKTALADEKAVGSPGAINLEGVTLRRVEQGGASVPVAFFKGSAPDVGVRVSFLVDGLSMVGTVKDAVETDGEVMVEFADGLSAVKNT